MDLTPALTPQALDMGSPRWMREVASGRRCRACGRMRTLKDVPPRIS
jgi:hypothetical protein